MAGKERPARLVAFDAIVRDVKLTGQAVRVAWRIIDRMGSKGVSWPSARTIAAELGLKERAVRAAIASLVSEGHLVRVQHKGRGRSNQYRLKSDHLHERARFKETPTEIDENVHGYAATHARMRRENVHGYAPESLKESKQESPQCAETEKTARDALPDGSVELEVQARRRVWKRYGAYTEGLSARSAEYRLIVAEELAGTLTEERVREITHHGGANP